MKKMKIKTEKLPLIVISSVVIIITLMLISSTAYSQTSSKNVSSNYQVTGTVDKSRFTIMRAYFKDNNLVIENKIETLSDGSIQNKSIYYKLGTDESNKVIKEGFLTNEIIADKKFFQSGNIKILIYGISDVEELENAEPLFQIIIDRSEIVNNVDLKTDLLRFDKLSSNEKTELTQFIDLNYVNKRLINFYTGNTRELLKPYLKANKEAKQQELNKLIIDITEQYNYYKELGNMIGVSFDELIKNAMLLNENSITFNTAISTSIDYIDTKISEQIKVLEIELLDKGVNLSDYDKSKNNYPLKMQYEYLKKISDEKKEEEAKKKEEESKKKEEESKKKEEAKKKSNK